MAGAYEPVKRTDSVLNVCLTYTVKPFRLLLVILSYRDKDTERFANGERVKAFAGFSEQASRRLSILNAAVSRDTLRNLPSNIWKR